MNVKIKKLHPLAMRPTYGSPGAACFDMYAVLDDPIAVEPGSSRVLNTGLAFEIPEGWCMKVYSRSGHGFNYDVSLSNSVGVIDSDYRGEVKVKLRNDSDMPFVVTTGDRIAQAEIVPAWQHDFAVVVDLSETERGEGGFGSTGR